MWGEVRKKKTRMELGVWFVRLNEVGGPVWGRDGEDQDFSFVRVRFKVPTLRLSGDVFRTVQPSWKFQKRKPRVPWELWQGVQLAWG